MEFPFDIYIVAERLGMVPKRVHAMSSDYDCPFCGGKSKLNLNIERGTFRCNKCSRNGGMLDLYCSVTGLHDRKEAYKILSDSVNDPYTQKLRRVRQEATDSIQEVEKATVAEIDRCYKSMLGFLTLNPKHRQNLLNRGLTDKEIDSIGYKSVPLDLSYKMPNLLREYGIKVIGIPGFYTDKNGSPRLNIHECMAGFFVPVRNSIGQIRAMQIRLDTPLEGKRKYMWLSSSERNGGCSSNSPIDVCGDVRNSTAIYITEGPLKGQIAHALSGKPFLSIAGVSQIKELERAFKCIQKNGKCKIIVDTLDMDDDTNEHVRQAHIELAWLAEKYGFTPKRFLWDRKYKGIDDYLLACKKRKENKS